MYKNNKHMKKIKIKISNYCFDAIIYDTPTGEVIFNKLPLKGEAIKWGDEIYFYINLKIELEKNAKEELEIGELGYWPVGPAFCIFFGKTPISLNEKPRAYSHVNVFGKIIDNNNIIKLKSIKNGDEISVEKA